MSVSVQVPSMLQEHAGGAAEVVVEGSPGTVADTLAGLFRAHPGLRDRLLDERGVLREHVNLFVGTESIRYTGGLETAVPDGGVVTILPALSGG
ncbi:MAG TPA: MoaD/ThiS family protein [Thermoanaerobaculia bacterium]|nr:MoaD/ThiS family protein [Thermoanaerobaculia bacterium]